MIADQVEDAFDSTDPEPLREAVADLRWLIDQFTDDHVEYARVLGEHLATRLGKACATDLVREAMRPRAVA